ncbi:MAG: F0F1 ATP synthase subunit delta [Acidobacteria bacterium]|nr:F0F1 ATP synthase subunit delta [Acidobacteriota bacterium]
MSVTTVSNRYGRALVDVVLSKGTQAEIKSEVSTFASMFDECKDLKEVFSNPTVSQQQQKKLLDSLIERTKPNAITANFLQLLLQNYRLQYLPEISKAFSRILDERLNIITANITTATSVSEDQKQLLKDQLHKLTGKEVRLNFSIDPTIIGGVVTQIGSQIYDGSIRNHLEQLRAKLSKD